jgi:hypothetical protein
VDRRGFAVGVSGPQDRAHGPFHLLTRTENPPLSVLLTGSPAPAKNENGVEITQVALVRPRDQKSLVTRWCVSNIEQHRDGWRKGLNHLSLLPGRYS